MEIMKHNNIMDKMEDDDNNWKCQELLEHRIKGRKKKQDIEVKCCWNDINQNTSQMDMFELAIQDPIPIIKYAYRRHLMSQFPFHHLIKYCNGEAASQMAKAFKAKNKIKSTKIKFGIQIPTHVREDKKNQKRQNRHQIV